MYPPRSAAADVFDSPVDPPIRAEPSLDAFSLRSAFISSTMIFAGQIKGGVDVLVDENRRESAGRYRAHSTHTRQSRLDSGLDLSHLLGEVVDTSQVVAFSLGIG